MSRRRRRRRIWRRISSLSHFTPVRDCIGVELIRRTPNWNLVDWNVVVQRLVDGLLRLRRFLIVFRKRACTASRDSSPYRWRVWRSLRRRLRCCCKTWRGRSSAASLISSWRSWRRSRMLTVGSGTESRLYSGNGGILVGSAWEVNFEIYSVA